MNVEHDEDKNSREKYFVEKKKWNVDSFLLFPVTFFNLKLKIVSHVVCPFTKQIRLPLVTVYYMFVF